MLRLFHFSQNYSIFALDFPIMLYGDSLGVIEKSGSLRKYRNLCEKFCKLKKTLYLCTSVRRYNLPM